MAIAAVRKAAQRKSSASRARTQRFGAALGRGLGACATTPPRASRLRAQATLVNDPAWWDPSRTEGVRPPSRRDPEPFVTAHFTGAGLTLRMMRGNNMYLGWQSREVKVLDVRCSQVRPLRVSVPPAFRARNQLCALGTVRATVASFGDNFCAPQEDPVQATAGSHTDLAAYMASDTEGLTSGPPSQVRASSLPPRCGQRATRLRQRLGRRAHTARALRASFCSCDVRRTTRRPPRRSSAPRRSRTPPRPWCTGATACSPTCCGATCSGATCERGLPSPRLVGLVHQCPAAGLCNCQLLPASGRWPARPRRRLWLSPLSSCCISLRLGGAWHGRKFKRLAAVRGQECA